MTTLALAIHKLMSAGPKVGSAIKLITSPRDVAEKLQEAEARNNRDVGQVCLAVCRALVAHELGREPTGEEVTRFFEAGIGDPAFPARVHRLFGEARKAASWRRRAFLASMLFGLSFDSLPDDERDRVDMAVERMMPADVSMLVLLAKKDGEATAALPADTISYMFGPSRVSALLNRMDLRLATTDDWEVGSGFTSAVTEDVRFIADRTAFASLISLGCVDLGQSKSLIGDWNVHQVGITPLGRSVLKALEEVGAGLGACPAGPDEAQSSERR